MAERQDHPARLFVLLDNLHSPYWLHPAARHQLHYQKEPHRVHFGHPWPLSGKERGSGVWTLFGPLCWGRPQFGQWRCSVCWGEGVRWRRIRSSVGIRFIRNNSSLSPPPSRHSNRCSKPLPKCLKENFVSQPLYRVECTVSQFSSDHWS